VALGATVLASGAIVAFGATGRASGGAVLVALGAVCALGAERPARCAEHTPVNKLSNNPAKISILMYLSLLQHSDTSCTNVANNYGKGNTRVIQPLGPVVGNFYSHVKICHCTGLIVEIGSKSPPMWSRP
jgi:hypothetical protein